jgi:hypothetical protein
VLTVFTRNALKISPQFTSNVTKAIVSCNTNKSHDKKGSNQLQLQNLIACVPTSTSSTLSHGLYLICYMSQNPSYGIIIMMMMMMMMMCVCVCVCVHMYMYTLYKHYICMHACAHTQMHTMYMCYRTKILMGGWILWWCFVSIKKTLRQFNILQHIKVVLLYDRWHIHIHYW